MMTQEIKEVELSREEKAGLLHPCERQRRRRRHGPNTLIFSGQPDGGCWAGSEALRLTTGRVAGRVVAALVLIALGSISIEAHPRRVAALVELNRLIDQRPTDGELYRFEGLFY